MAYRPSPIPPVGPIRLRPRTDSQRRAVRNSARSPLGDRLPFERFQHWTAAEAPTTETEDIPNRRRHPLMADEK